MNDVEVTPEIDPHAGRAAMASPSWQIKSAGEGLAKDRELTLRYYKISGADAANRFVWEVYAGDYIGDPVRGPKANRRLGSSEHLPMAMRPLTGAGARVDAERFAFAWRAGELPPGSEVQLTAAWLVKRLGLEDAIANNGGWGNVPTEAVVLVTRGPDDDDPAVTCWSCSTEIAGVGLAFTGPANGDDQAREVLGAWKRHQELQGVASASEEANARAESRQTALDGVRAACGEPTAEDGDEDDAEELEIPARTPDLVQTEDAHAFIGLSDEEKLKIGDELVEEMRLRDVEEAAKKLAVDAYNKTIKAHDTRASRLAKQRREGGEDRPVPHRMEYYYSENVVVVTREDTGEETDRRRMTPRERQRIGQPDLPLTDGEDASEEPATEETPDTAPEPFELVVGMDLVSTGGSGGMVRVLELHPADPEDEESVDRVTTQKLTKKRELHGRAKPQRVAREALFAAYRPVEAPSAPSTEQEPGEDGETR